MLRNSIESEKTIEATLVRLVKNNGGLCIKLVPTFISGLPDRLVLLPTKIIFFVETKSTGDKARKLQLKIHALITKLGFTVYTPNTVEEIKLIIHQNLKQ